MKEIEQLRKALERAEQAMVRWLRLLESLV